jgi:hypothetical protein
MPNIIVGFTTRPREDADLFMPRFEAPSVIKDQEERDRWAEQRRAMFQLDMANIPHFGEIEYIYMAAEVGSGTYRYAHFEADDAANENPDGPVATRIASALMSWFPEYAHRPNAGSKSPPEIQYFGFNMDVFADLLRVQIAEVDTPLPAAFTSDARYTDLKELVLPYRTCLDKVPMDVVIARFGITLPEEMVYEPGDDPKLDAMVASAIMNKLHIANSSGAFLQALCKDLLADLRLTGDPSAVASPTTDAVTAVEATESAPAKTGKKKKTKAKAKKANKKAKAKKRAKAKA